MSYELIQILLSAGLFWAIAVGLPLGASVAIVVLARFRARVSQSMRESARTNGRLDLSEEPAQARAALAEDVQGRPPLTVEFERPEAVLAAAASDAGSGSPASAKRQARRVAVVYGAAASIFVLITLVIFHRFVSPFEPTERVLLKQFVYFMSFSSALATPVVLAATYVLKKQVRHLAVAILALLAVVAVWELFLFDGTLFPIWLWTSAAPTTVALLLVTRRLRAVGPVAIVGIAVWSAVSAIVVLLGVQYALDLMGVRFIQPDLQGLGPVAALGKYAGQLGSQERWLSTFEALTSGSLEGRLYVVEQPQREDAARLVAYATFMIAFVASAGAAWAAVTRVASASRRRRASEQMLTIDVIVLAFVVPLFGIHFQPGLEGEGRALAIAALSAAAFIAYKLAALAELRLLRKIRPPGPVRTLLLLRVFGFDRRMQRLLDDLGQRWRYLGPIRLIAGPDLAYATVEPHEFYDFLSGRLSRAFVKDRDDLESRLSQDAAIAAPDGLYSVEDFFCHDDTWRMTVSRLAGDADAVFMDLRGFSPTNRGCIFEIEQLIAWVPLERIVFLVDQTTDVPLLEQTLAAAWRSLPADSLNVSLEKPVVRVLHASRNHWRTLNALMAKLCAPFDSVQQSRIAPVAAGAST